MFIGYLEESPDYWTQGNSLEELQENLLDLYQEFSRNNIPAIRKIADNYQIRELPDIIDDYLGNLPGSEDWKLGKR